MADAFARIADEAADTLQRLPDGMKNAAVRNGCVVLIVVRVYTGEGQITTSHNAVQQPGKYLHGESIVGDDKQRHYWTTLADAAYHLLRVAAEIVHEPIISVFDGVFRHHERHGTADALQTWRRRWYTNPGKN